MVSIVHPWYDDRIGLAFTWAHIFIDRQPSTYPSLSMDLNSPLNAPICFLFSINMNRKPILNASSLFVQTYLLTNKSNNRNSPNRRRVYFWSIAGDGMDSSLWRQITLVRRLWLYRVIYIYILDELSMKGGLFIFESFTQISIDIFFSKLAIHTWLIYTAYILSYMYGCTGVDSIARYIYWSTKPVV